MNIKCDISIDFDFQSNDKMLNLVYLPIIGKDAISLFNYLVTMNQYHKEMGTNISLYVNDLIQGLGFDQTQFDNNLHLLEGIGLVNTYFDQNKGDFMLFVVNTPLNWKQFNQEPKMMAVYKNSVDEMTFEKNKFLFEGNNKTLGLVNHSQTFDQTFNLKEESFTLNFDFVYEMYLKQTGNFITLSQDNKVILNNAYTKFNLSIQDINGLLLEASIKDNNNLVLIDNKLLTMALKRLVDVKYVKNFNTKTKLNRNKKIFIKNANLNDFKYIIEDYKTLNSEQYLACMQKHTLNDLELSMIKNLRSNYNLPDFAINILIDYCVVINNGRVEPQYINKIALSINRLGLTSVNDIIIHLQNASSKRNATMLQQYGETTSGGVKW